MSKETNIQKLNLSKDQQKALEQIIKWVSNEKSLKYLTLAGFAGTGKTTLISVLRKELKRIDKKKKVAFCAYTGKAVRILESKLKEQGALFSTDSTSTIHGLIYTAVENDRGEIIGWAKKDQIEYDLIIVDEASMIDRQIWQDLRSYNKKILAVGDHGQLPPIKGSFNLMEKPMIKLQEIHRQARENPIIEISILARTKGKIPIKKFQDKVIKINRSDYDAQEMVTELFNTHNENSLVLCGYNRTRVNLNKYIRELKFFETPQPSAKDRVICLRNNHEKKIYNGMLGTIQSIHRENENYYNAKVSMDGEETPYVGFIATEQFHNLTGINFTKKRAKFLDGDLFDFGYAITVHKAQGSQAKRVVLFEERFSKMSDLDWQRWLYTAVTRAEEELYIVGY